MGLNINFGEMGLRWVRKDYKVISLWHRGSLVVAYLQISTRGVSEDCRSDNADHQTVENLALTKWHLNKPCFAHQKDWGAHDMLMDLTDVVFMEEDG